MKWFLFTKIYSQPRTKQKEPQVAHRKIVEMRAFLKIWSDHHWQAICQNEIALMPQGRNPNIKIHMMYIFFLHLIGKVCCHRIEWIIKKEYMYNVISRYTDIDCFFSSLFLQNIYFLRIKTSAQTRCTLFVGIYLCICYEWMWNVKSHVPPHVCSWKLIENIRAKTSIHETTENENSKQNWYSTNVLCTRKLLYCWKWSFLFL